MDNTISILFLAANPGDTAKLGLDEEIRAIDQALRQADFRDRFVLHQQWAVRAVDIQGHLLRYKPDIVHFSGHGSTANEIILEDKNGYSHPVSEFALGKLFSLLKDNIRCIVLNACYSESQARSIAEHIDCVVGMSAAFGDSSAISFASAFYLALGFGKDVKTAFDLARLQIDLENLGEQDTPQLIAVHRKPEQIVFGRVSSFSPEVSYPDDQKKQSLGVAQTGGALAIWREKLAYLQEQEAITSEFSQKFSLRKQIEEARMKIQELGG